VLLLLLKLHPGSKVFNVLLLLLKLHPGRRVFNVLLYGILPSGGLAMQTLNARQPNAEAKAAGVLTLDVQTLVRNDRVERSDVKAIL